MLCPCNRSLFSKKRAELRETTETDEKTSYCVHIALYATDTFYSFLEFDIYKKNCLMATVLGIVRRKNILMHSIQGIHVNESSFKPQLRVLI